MNPATQAYQRNVIARFGNLSFEGLARMENQRMRAKSDVVANVVRPQYVSRRPVSEIYETIISLVQQGNGTVSDFARGLNRDPSTVRDHLRKMVLDGTLKAKNVGQVRVYSLQEAAE